MNEPLVFVLFDGINNSVFESQVIAPLRKFSQENPHRPIHLISFEKKPSKARMLHLDFNLHVTYLKKYIFLGQWSLFFCIRALHSYLKKLPAYSIKARGPLAGYICLHAAIKTKCTELIIQARGLLAAEYEYIHRSDALFKRIIHMHRKKWYEKIEYTVYRKNLYPFDVKIESVSKALSQWLISHFDASANAIIEAKQDIPESIPQEKRLLWRTEIRNKLTIPENAVVYCYNGSAHAWQLPHATVGLFKQILAKEPHAILLILTQEQETFKKLIQHVELELKNYRICSVAHKNIYEYLAAADVGLILREPHPINWISRPTKVIEYRAIGLPILHNHTIAMLSDNLYNNNPAIIAESKLESEPPRTA